MTQHDALITKNYIWAFQKINLKDQNFFVRNWGEKNFFKIWNIELDKNGEYDLAWCADH